MDAGGYGNNGIHLLLLYDVMGRYLPIYNATIIK